MEDLDVSLRPTRWPEYHFTKREHTMKKQTSLITRGGRGMARRGASQNLSHGIEKQILKLSKGTVYRETVTMRRGRVYDKRFNELVPGYKPMIACDVCHKEIRGDGNVVFGKLTRKGRDRLFKHLTFTHKECYAESLLPRELRTGETFLVEVDLRLFLEHLFQNVLRPRRKRRAA